MLGSLLVLFLALTAYASQTPPELFSSLIPQKVLNTSRTLPSPIKYPQYTTTGNGTWLLFAPDTWTSGFFPSTPYALDSRVKLCPDQATKQSVLASTDWINLGRSLSTGLIPLETKNTQGHDVGFLSMPFMLELLVNPQNETAIHAINAFAADLAARFNPTVGCTRSWDTADPTDFTVIIDNMMNLEVLFSSFALTRNTTLRSIALTHARTTITNHIRADGSTWHGFSDSSTWSRGQAWGIYGFANVYRHVKGTEEEDEVLLDTARRLAEFFLDHIPKDGIVPWDFNAPVESSGTLKGVVPSDSSAATVAANGLLLLAQVEDNDDMKQRWTNGAIDILANITSLAWRPRWQSLLSNGTVNRPQNNFATGIVYGDYYYIAAGNMLAEMGLVEC
ncbi:glycoside hydrolase family 88 protein [Dendrothele bispora CBS 962.96]|uniref:Glycoside hydrolase family 88 protein n=1 Tax=Dendrothele bispora (strain CBS 962.96) TaxID=1314807 RepID=A0A4S8MZK5_DENBC|nr:glycoside hydrolase family 88 protein [Dendrothele bispora CBS 962.96]